MILKEAQKAETDGARVRAQELLGKWKGMFVEQTRDVTDRPLDQLLATLARSNPEAAALIAPLLGLDPSTIAHPSTIAQGPANDPSAQNTTDIKPPAA
jgi:hypothetical protein